MQILPQVNISIQTSAENGLSTGSDTAKRQSALFANLLSGSQSAGASTGTLSTASQVAATVTSGAMDLSASPSEQDIMTLPLTTEDLAALHDDLMTQGFSDEEYQGMQSRVQGGTGMTWGDMMREVRQKIASANSDSSKSSSTGNESSTDSGTSSTAAASEASGKGEKKDKKSKEISNDDKVELLGLFGKLGFTPTESQNLVDSLSRGETDSVFAAVDAKVAAMASDSTVSLTSSEMTALGRNMNLSKDAQDRLSTLFDHSNAEQGLSGQGITTAMALVKNELNAKLAQENQAMADFRDSASKVLSQAWQRQTGNQNADRHQDVVARKAGQVVAMGADKQSESTGVPSADKPGVNVLGDVPTSGKAAGTASQNAQDVLAQHADAKTASTATTTESEHKDTMARQMAAKDSANFATAANADANASTSGQHSGSSGSQAQNGQGGWGDFWSKVRVDKTAQTGSTSGQTTLTQTMAAMDGTKTNTANLQSAKTYDPTLASRAARQLETGLLRNLGQDAKQLTLKLNPEELGKLSVTLTVKDKEIKAVIAADNSDTATMLQDQSEHIKKTLQDQGFKVTKLEVQTGIAQDNRSSWQGTEQHNQAREQREAMDRLRSSWRMSRQGDSAFGDDATNAMVPGAMPSSSTKGLDLFA